MIIELENVSKRYGKKLAVDEMTVRFEEGIISMLGPNGAGKTTIMKLISGNSYPSSGKILCNGSDIHKNMKDYRSKIGYMPQQQMIYPFFTGRRFLEYIGVLKGIDRKQLRFQVEEIADDVNLSEFLDERVDSYSGGMKQRLLLAQAFLGNPLFVMLDEPTTGLDPLERIRARNMITRYAVGRIIIVTTHVLQDVEFISDRFVFLHRGRIQRIMSRGEIESAKCNTWEVKISTEDYKKYSDHYMVSRVFREEGFLRLRIVSEEGVENGWRVDPDIEDYYMSLFGEINGRSRTETSVE